MADTKDTGKLTASPDFWGSVIGGATSVIGGFNYKAQQNEIALEQARGATAQANADAERSTSTSKNFVWIAVAAAALIVIILLTRPAKAA